MTKTEIFLLTFAALTVIVPVMRRVLRSISDHAGIDDLIDHAENELK